MMVPPLIVGEIQEVITTNERVFKVTRDVS